jgi:hypothetical protein
MAAVSYERLPIHQSKGKQETIGLPKVINNFSGCPLVMTREPMLSKRNRGHEQKRLNMPVKPMIGP